MSSRGQLKGGSGSRWGEIQSFNMFMSYKKDLLSCHELVARKSLHCDQSSGWQFHLYHNGSSSGRQTKTACAWFDESRDYVVDGLVKVKGQGDDKDGLNKILMMIRCIGNQELTSSSFTSPYQIHSLTHNSYMPVFLNHSTRYVS